MKSKVITHCSIKNNTISLDGKPIFSTEKTDVASFLKAAFVELNQAYSKFYKMDNLAKLAFLGVEYLLQNNTITFGENEVALAVQNANSSADTDWKHQQSINQNTMASPAVFVYTLPNILLGEIAIKHKWYGENLFKLAPAFSFANWQQDAEQLFALNKANYCIGGWAECLEETYLLEFYLLAKDK